MAWTTPGTATAGSVLTAAFWNEQVRDNAVFLKSETDAVGLKLITTQTLNAITNNISSVFSSTYDSYRVVITGLQNGSTTTRNVTLRLRTSSDDSSAIYQWWQYVVYATSTAAADGLGASQTSIRIASLSQASYAAGGCSFDIFNPNAAAITVLHGRALTYQSDVSSFVDRQFSGLALSNTQYTGFSIIGTTDALSGTVRVYGYRNS